MAGLDNTNDRERQTPQTRRRRTLFLRMVPSRPWRPPVVAPVIADANSGTQLTGSATRKFTNEQTNHGAPATAELAPALHGRSTATTTAATCHSQPWRQGYGQVAPAYTGGDNTQQQQQQQTVPGNGASSGDPATIRQHQAQAEPTTAATGSKSQR